MFFLLPLTVPWTPVLSSWGRALLQKWKAMLWSAFVSCIFLLLVTLIFFIAPYCRHISQKPPALPSIFLKNDQHKDDLAYFFSAFLSSEGHIIVLLVGHTSLKGERWWCQIVRGEECFCSVQLMGIRNFQSQNWAVQRLECKFKLKEQGEVNSIRLRRSGQSSPFLVVSDPIFFWGVLKLFILWTRKIGIIRDFPRNWQQVLWVILHFYGLHKKVFFAKRGWRQAQSGAARIFRAFFASASCFQ